MSSATAFSQWFKQRRKSLGLTQKEVARQAGCAEVTLRKIEAGDLHPSAQLAACLAKCLGVLDADLPDIMAFARSAGVQPAPAVCRVEPRHPHNLPAQLTPPARPGAGYLGGARPAAGRRAVDHTHRVARRRQDPAGSGRGRERAGAIRARRLLRAPGAGQRPRPGPSRRGAGAGLPDERAQSAGRAVARLPGGKARAAAAGQLRARDRGRCVGGRPAAPLPVGACVGHLPAAAAPARRAAGAGAAPGLARCAAWRGPAAGRRSAALSGRGPVRGPRPSRAAGLRRQRRQRCRCSQAVPPLGWPAAGHRAGGVARQAAAAGRAVGAPQRAVAALRRRPARRVGPPAHLARRHGLELRPAQPGRTSSLHAPGCVRRRLHAGSGGGGVRGGGEWESGGGGEGERRRENARA